MPNGIDKNWHRLCAALDGFRVRYGSWPTKIRLPEGAIEYLFTKETYAKLEERLKLIYDDSPYIAEDEAGQIYNYGQEGFPDEPPDIPAFEWLAVEPDSEMVKEYYMPRRRAQGSGPASGRMGYLSALLSDIALASVAIVLFGIAGKESGVMGFILFTAAAIAFSVAAVISIVVGAVGVALYLWRGRGSQRTRRAFWYSLFGVVLVGTVIINVIPFPQAPAGSNYSEMANEWIVKAVVYALIPGAACLLGGIASMFARMMARKDRTDG
ncbi:MAG: hypothetical protein AB1649_31755 [Chloroflexota bacterium]